MLIRMFFEFFKIGIVTLGGGQAMLPILQHSLVRELHWITQEKFLYFVSVAEVTPGPVALNMATFIGYDLGGVIGSIIATLGVIAPSFLVILIVAHFEKKFKENAIYRRFMLGVKPVIIALLINASYLIIQHSFTTPVYYLMALVGLFIFTLYKKSPVLILLIAGFTGIFILK